MKPLKNASLEALSSVLPISAIVLLLSISVSPLNAGVLVLFLFGTLLLILGMGLFTIGSEISMYPLGESIGNHLNHAKRLPIPMIVCLVLGVLITIAEPDLQVLAEQIPSIPNATLIWAVAIGVGIFLAIAMLRARSSGSEQMDQIMDAVVSEEKEIISILSPENVGEAIMEAVNREFGLHTKAAGVVCAVPVEKAFKV